MAPGRRAAPELDEPAARPGRQDRPRRGSLPTHLERVVMRPAARANGSIGGEFDRLIDAAARELDLARSVASGLRGETRHALIDGWRRSTSRFFRPPVRRWTSGRGPR